MKPIYNIIIEPYGERYNNNDDINGKPLIMNTTIDDKDFQFTNRMGVVKSIPLLPTPFKVGDLVVVHHNVFRKYWSFGGRLRTSSSDLDNNQFRCELDQVYAYKRDGMWTCVDDWVFVKPVEIDKTGQILFETDTYEPEEGLYEMGDLPGVSKGNRVIFEPNANYEVRFDNMILYRMKSKFITGKYI